MHQKYIGDQTLKVRDCLLFRATSGADVCIIEAGDILIAITSDRDRNRAQHSNSIHSERMDGRGKRTTCQARLEHSPFLLKFHNCLLEWQVFGQMAGVHNSFPLISMPCSGGLPVY